MIIAIRISGLVEMPPTEKETLFRMRLRKKYTAVLLKETSENINLLQKVRNFIAYGKLNPATYEALISKRAKPLGGTKTKIDSKKIIETIEKSGVDNAGIKPFFGLHPPRGGIKSKIHFPKGILGDNGDKINDLVGRML